MSDDVNLWSVLRALAGSLVGAVAGYIVFVGLGRWGIDAHAVTGGIVGFVCGFFAGRPSWIHGLCAAVVAAATCVYSEWRWFPFEEDEGLGFFLRHFGDLPSGTLILMGVAVVLAFWLGVGNVRPPRRREVEEDEEPLKDDNP